MLAHDDKGGIAKNGKIPWPHLKKDMKAFENNTKGDVVVMGSKTFFADGMPKPLPNRYNVVLTTNPEKAEKAGAHFGFNGSFLDFIQKAETFEHNIWVIGGAKVFKEAFPCINEIRLTHVHGDYGCDTYIDLDEIHQNYTKIFNTRENENSIIMDFSLWRKL